MDKTIVKTANAPSAIGPYSQGVIAGGKLLFTAGQVAIDPASGKVIEGDVRVQTRQAMKNVEAILTEAGASLASVVKTTVFLKDMNDFAAMNETYGEFFKENPPSRSTVEVVRLPKDVRVEIEAIASL
jgi:2-iminobutanoate/2-iminopropanoate deaminase